MNKDSALYKTGLKVYRRVSKKQRQEVSEELLNELIDKYYGADFPHRKKLIKDVRKGYYKYGGYYVDNYFKFNFFDLKKHARKTYSVEIKNSLMADWKYFNNQEYSNYFFDKYLFDQTFEKYLKRKYMLFNKDTKFEEFLSFALSGSIFFKPRYGNLGKGVFRKDIKDEAEAREFFDKLQAEGEDYVVEEFVTNEATLREFHPASVNTLRIVSILTKHGPEILCTYQRFGNNGYDQDHSNTGALQALVDKETGIVTTHAIVKGNQPLVIHPYSGKVVPGYQLKNWDQCIALVKEMAQVVPEVRFIGWDITINDKEEWIVIEGNCDGGFEAAQTLWRGLQPDIDKVKKEDEGK